MVKVSTVFETVAREREGGRPFMAHRAVQLRQEWRGREPKGARQHNRYDSATDCGQNCVFGAGRSRNT